MFSIYFDDLLSFGLPNIYVQAGLKLNRNVIIFTQRLNFHFLYVPNRKTLAKISPLVLQKFHRLTIKQNRAIKLILHLENVVLS